MANEFVARRGLLVPSGNVLIGTTSSSGVDKVRVNNDGTTSYSTVNITNANSTANMYVGVGGSSVANGSLQNNAYVWNAAASALVLGTSDTERMRITSAGNVGIGTTSPISAGGGYRTLNIDGSGASLVLSSAGSNSAYIYTSGTGFIDFSIENAGAQIFRAGSSERMRILSGGNIAIGKTTAATILDVNGTITATSFSGAGTGLTGTASSLSIGGTAASETLATVTARGFITRASSGAFASASQDVPGLEVYGAGSTQPAFMTFHRPGAYAIKLGLDGTELKVGGWSMGAVAYVILHSGNYTSYSPSLTGSGASGTWGISITGNSATSTTFSTVRTNYKGVTDGAVAGQLMWKNYGNNHTIFDASAGTSPNGGAVSQTNSANAWTATYPTLMGWNGSTTYGVRVDSCRLADSAGNASTLGGLSLNGTTNNAANAVVRTDGNGYANFGWINTISGVATGTPSRVYCSEDAYIRYYSMGTFTSYVQAAASGTWGINITGNASNITAYSINQNLSTTSGPTFGDVYNNGWFRNYGTTGVYNQTYGSHFRVSTNASHGTWETFGYSKNGYAGLNIIDSSGYWNNHMFEGGNGGVYQENGAGWLWYYNRTYGSFTIGGATVSGSYKLYVEGSIYATGVVDWASDVRKKENIITLDSPLEKITKLRGVYFNRIDDPKKKIQTGVIAQEVKEVIPELVNYDDMNDSYSVSYGNFAGLFIEAIKEQQTQIENLKQEIEILKNK